MSFLFKNYSLVELIDLLIRFNKTMSFLCNIKNTDRNGVNEKNTHTTHRERCDSSFFSTTPYFTNPSVFMGKF